MRVRMIGIGLVTIAMTAALAACSGAMPASADPDGIQLPSAVTGETFQSSPADPNQSSQTDSSGTDAQADLKNQQVEITIPGSIFGGDADMSDFDADAYAEGMGFLSGVLNEDGSMTVVMTAQKQQELLTSIVAQYEKRSEGMVGAKTAPYIQSITHTDGFETITVDVDRAAYEAAESKIAPGMLGVQGLSYQAFSGADLHVEIIFRDGNTGDIVDSFLLPDDLEK